MREGNVMTNLSATGGVPGPGRIGRVAIGDLLKRAAARGIDLIAVDFTGTAAAQGLENFNDLIEGQSEIEPEIDFDDRDLAMIIYTSGTTSRPKGAMHCHLAVVMAVMSNAIEMHLDRHDGVTGQFPLFHCAGHVLLLSYLSVGGRMALMRGFDPLVCMEAIVRR